MHFSTQMKISILSKNLHNVHNISVECEDLHNCNTDDSDSDDFNEVDDAENPPGNMDTLLDEPDPQVYTFAPGEGQKPLSLFQDVNSEYLAWPTIFCGQTRPDNSKRQRPVHYSDICKYELRHVDRRVSLNIPNLFFKLKKLQIKQISDKVTLSMRRCKTKGKKYTASDVLNDEIRANMVRLDEGFYIFRSLRNSPPYLEKRKKDIFAMIRQLGFPVIFMSMSAADVHWTPLLKTLGQLVDKVNYTSEDIDHFDWATRSRLVSSDPVTCARYFDYKFQHFMNIILKSSCHPVGEITDYFYRVEFQQRGSSHIHMTLWVKDAPRYGEVSDEEIIEYINSIISVSADVPKEDKKYLKLQYHKHSKTCKKGKKNPVCRFGYPIAPMRNTKILTPLDTENNVLDIQKLKEDFKKLQLTLSSLPQDEHLSFDDFLQKIDMSENDYIQVIRSSLRTPKVFLKREPDESRINPCMKHLLNAWQANHDIQYVLDAFSMAVYIVAYTCKSQKGMSGILDTACKEARKDNMELKQAVRHMGNKFPNCSEIGAQEAAYLVLQLPVTRCSREVIFIHTAPQNDRTFVLREIKKLRKLPPK